MNVGHFDLIFNVSLELFSCFSSFWIIFYIFAVAGCMLGLLAAVLLSCLAAVGQLAS
jgi:hypothetical protein